MKKVKLRQHIANGEIVIKVMRGTDTLEVFKIIMLESPTSTTFGVTSNKGIDTAGNGLEFLSIETAIKYIKNSDYA